MNDELRREVERHFDGEPPEAEASKVLDRLVDDPEARRHLDHLARLRALARRHDPASGLPRRRAPSLPTPRHRPIARWAALACLAASVVLLVRVFGGGGTTPSTRPIVSVPRSSTGPIPSTVDRPPLEVELYRWANAPIRAPGQAARLVLSPVGPARKRSPADEILALELANAPAKARGDVRRFAASRGARPTPQARPTASGPRPRAAQPTA